MYSKNMSKPLIARPSVLRSLSALSINISAVWFGAVFVFPDLGIQLPQLTVYLGYGIVYLIFGIIIEEYLDNE